MDQITSTSDKLTKKNIINRINDVPGGVSLAMSTLVAGNVVQEGTPLSAPASGVRSICKQAKILAGSTTTAFKVETGTHNFKVGDFIGRITGGLAYAITGVTVGASEDTIEVGTALESATVGEFIYEMAAESSTTTSALKNEADVILKEAFQVPTATQVIYMADAFVRADVHAGVIGPLYLASLDVKEIKY